MADFALFFDGTQCLPLYRYTPDGERVSNITDWGIKRINDHFRKEWRGRFDKTYPNGIDAEEIFAYTYAVLHDPVYRYDYANDLLREFPRLPLYNRDFDLWAKMGRELLDLHIGFETAEPFDLERRESRLPNNNAPKVILKPDKEKGLLILDEQTTLAGVPDDAWRYELGSRSALEWVLGPVQGEEAARRHHSRKVQHLPLRRPQRARHRPAQARLHRQRQDDGRRR